MTLFPQRLFQKAGCWGQISHTRMITTYAYSRDISAQKYAQSRLAPAQIALR
jgi:hypothetical protein